MPRRKDDDDIFLCNACGLYRRLRGRDRPVDLKSSRSRKGLKPDRGKSQDETPPIYPQDRRASVGLPEQHVIPPLSALPTASSESDPLPQEARLSVAGRHYSELLSTVDHSLFVQRSTPLSLNRFGQGPQ